MVDWILDCTLSAEMKLQDLHVEPLFESEFVLVASKSNMHRHHHAGVVEERTVGVATNQYGV